MSMELLKDANWLKKNEDELKNTFPAVWTHTENIKDRMLPFRFKLKLLGVDYRSEDDVRNILTFLTKIGILEVRSLGPGAGQIRRNPHSIFS